MKFIDRQHTVDAEMKFVMLAADYTTNKEADETNVELTQTKILGCRRIWLLTYSMVQSPSWEANWFAASQEIPRILWNPKVHYRTHKRPPPVPILG